jgi:hypothetical protein
VKLTQGDKDKVVKWLGERCGQMRCFCCGHARWQLLETASIHIGFDTHTTRFHYHEGVPQVTVACENCGHLINFAATLLGLKPDQPPAETVPAAPPGA